MGEREWEGEREGERRFLNPIEVSYCTAVPGTNMKRGIQSARTFLKDPTCNAIGSRFYNDR